MLERNRLLTKYFKLFREIVFKRKFFAPREREKEKIAREKGRKKKKESIHLARRENNLEGTKKL